MLKDKEDEAIKQGITAQEESFQLNIQEQIEITDEKFVVPERIRHCVNMIGRGQSTRYLSGLTDKEAEYLICEAIAGYEFFLSRLPDHIKKLPIYEYHDWLELQMQQYEEGAD